MQISIMKQWWNHKGSISQRSVEGMSFRKVYLEDMDEYPCFIVLLDKSPGPVCIAANSTDFWFFLDMLPIRRNNRPFLNRPWVYPVFYHVRKDQKYWLTKLFCPVPVEVGAVWFFDSSAEICSRQVDENIATESKFGLRSGNMNFLCVRHYWLLRGQENLDKVSPLMFCRLATNNFLGECVFSRCVFWSRNKNVLLGNRADFAATSKKAALKDNEGSCNTSGRTLQISTRLSEFKTMLYWLNLLQLLTFNWLVSVIFWFSTPARIWSECCHDPNTTSQKGYAREYRPLMLSFKLDPELQKEPEPGFNTIIGEPSVTCEVKYRTEKRQCLVKYNHRFRMSAERENG